jgi:hypothetical protein
LSSVTTMRAKRVGSSVVSAITQTPASAPFAELTVPEIALLPAAATGIAARNAAGRRTFVNLAIDGRLLPFAGLVSRVL